MLALLDFRAHRSAVTFASCVDCLLSAVSGNLALTMRPLLHGDTIRHSELMTMFRGGRVASEALGQVSMVTSIAARTELSVGTHVLCGCCSTLS